MKMKIDGISLRQLRCLRAVADSGSLTGAASLLGLTTPAIHSQLRGLEELASRPLVARAEHGAFRPTPEGADRSDGGTAGARFVRRKNPRGDSSCRDRYALVIVRAVPST